MILSIYYGGICLLIKDIYTNTKYKDALFRFIFNNPYDLLSLYNAVNNTNYSNIDSFYGKKLVREMREIFDRDTL